MTGANRFMQLQDRQVDLLMSEDTHTVERELKEVRDIHFIRKFLFIIILNLPTYS